MKFFLLENKFYSDYSNCPEILIKMNRPYVVFLINLNNLIALSFLLIIIRKWYYLKFQVCPEIRMLIRHRTFQASIYNSFWSPILSELLLLQLNIVKLLQPIRIWLPEFFVLVKVNMSRHITAHWLRLIQMFHPLENMRLLCPLLPTWLCFHPSTEKRDSLLPVIMLLLLPWLTSLTIVHWGFIPQFVFYLFCFA